MSLIFLVMQQILGLRIIKVFRYVMICVLQFVLVALDNAFRFFRFVSYYLSLIPSWYSSRS